MNAWYADAGCNYKYSGIQLEHNLWSPTLNIIRNKIKNCTIYPLIRAWPTFIEMAKTQLAGIPMMNQSLEKTLLFSQLVLVKSFRYAIKTIIDLKYSTHSQFTANYEGSLQHIYEHQVLKNRKSKIRVNLTFRNVY